MTTAHGFPLALSHLAYFTTYLRHNVLGLMLKMKRKEKKRRRAVDKFRNVRLAGHENRIFFLLA